jgi:hypothetical protein
VIVESKHAKAFCCEKSIAPLVARFMSVFKVLAAIDLDDELRGVRDEIDDVGTDGCLTTEARAFEPMRAKPIPHDAFGWR